MVRQLRVSKVYPQNGDEFLGFFTKDAFAQAVGLALHGAHTITIPGSCLKKKQKQNGTNMMYECKIQYPIKCEKTPEQWRYQPPADGTVGVVRWLLLLLLLFLAENVGCC